MPNPNRDDYEDLPDRLRDPGADPEAAGIPESAEDLNPGVGLVDDPERESMPTEAPVVSTSFGTTADEQLQGEGLERKLAREEPDVGQPGWHPDVDLRDSRPAEEAAMHIEDEESAAALDDELDDEEQ